MQIHVVKNGDTLWQISEVYGADLNQVILANEINNPSTLVVGQTLVIPEPSQEYVVQSGDQLWRIAQMYGVSVQRLAEVNNISDPNLLFVGDVLEIPSVEHVVQAGETLWQIANRYGTTVESLMQINQGISPSQLFIGQIIQIPANNKPVAEVNAYITDTTESGREEVLRLGRHFTYLSPFMYAITEQGTLQGLQDEIILEAADRTNTDSLLVITNLDEAGNFNSDLAATILRNPDLQDRLITNILEIMNTKGYSGLNIDFEYVYPEDRENYNAFLRRVVERLHPQGYVVSTAVAPKESGDQEGLLYEAHDYEAHGEIVDFVILMSYEWGWAGGPPWAIAPINKVKDVLDYAVTVIPPEKILMGVPLYGRDWEIPRQEGTFARTISPEQAIDLARKYKVAIQYNETYQAPFFHYVDENGQEHEVWFEDARSMQAKYDVVKDYNLRGVSYWVLGQNFPQNWPVLQSKFQVRKL